MSSSVHIVLASSSKRRLELLARIGVVPDLVVAPDIDETPLKKEKVANMVKRLAYEKAALVSLKYPNSVIIAADTAAVCSNKILGKPRDYDDAQRMISLLSGRRHRVYTGVCIGYHGNLKLRLSESIVKFKKLRTSEIKSFLSRKEEWDGKAGGYTLQGFAGAFVEFLRGDHSGVLGLPLCDTYKMLQYFNAL